MRVSHPNNQVMFGRVISPVDQARLIRVTEDLKYFRTDALFRAARDIYSNCEGDPDQLKMAWKTITDTAEKANLTGKMKELLSSVKRSWKIN